MATEGPGPILRAGVLVSACVLILSAPLAGLYGLKELLAETAPLAWPETIGTIRKSHIEQKDNPENPEFRIRATYDYEVNGKKYTSERIYLDDRTFFTAEGAIEAKQPFRTGNQTTVYYNAAKPEDALLVRGRRTSSWIWLFSPLVLAGTGALLLWGWLVVRKDLRKKKIPKEFDI